MKVAMSKKAMMVEDGFVASPYCIQAKTYGVPRLKFDAVTAIVCDGKPAQMHYNMHDSSEPVNRIAAGLAPHLGFEVRGSVKVVISTTQKYMMRVWAPHAEVRRLIKHVEGNLTAPPVIMPLFGQKITTDIFTETQAEMFLIRLCL